MMNRMMRSFGLFLLATSAGCAAQLGAPGEEGGGNDLAATAATGPVYGEREGTPFSPRVLSQLEKRGIKVADEDAERTTVEQQWIVPGYPMSRVSSSQVNSIPNRYATNLLIRWPRVVSRRRTRPLIDPTVPGEKGSCSGTLVGNTAVLTAAHCVRDWHEIGTDPATNLPVSERVTAYSIDARPRRNGGNAPQGRHRVRKSFWRFSSWPGTNPDGYENDEDFAVVRLKTSPTPAIPVASLREIPSPMGVSIEAAHYPSAFERSFGMYNSVGDIDALNSVTVGGTIVFDLAVYTHRMSMEPGSSGAGIFEFGVDGVSGVVISEDRPTGNRRAGQTRRGFPNQALIFTSGMISDINTWINTPL